MNRTKPTQHSSEINAGELDRRERVSSTVSSWLRLQTSQESHIDLVGAQDDSMAVGARKAFSEITESERARWMKIPMTGCDGMPKTGQAWVRSGTLAATIFIRPNTDLAIEMLVDAIKSGATLPEHKGDRTGVGAFVEGSGCVGGKVVQVG